MTKDQIIDAVKAEFERQGTLLHPGLFPDQPHIFWIDNDVDMEEFADAIIKLIEEVKAG